MFKIRDLKSKVYKVFFYFKESSVSSVQYWFMFFVVQIFGLDVFEWKEVKIISWLNSLSLSIGIVKFFCKWNLIKSYVFISNSLSQ